MLEESTPGAQLTSHHASEKHYFLTSDFIAKAEVFVVPY